MAFVGKTINRCFYPGCEEPPVLLLYCQTHRNPYPIVMDYAGREWKKRWER